MGPEEKFKVRGTFVPLLGALVLFLVIAPLVQHLPLLATTMISLLLLAGTFTVYRSPSLRITVVLALVVVLTLYWCAYFVVGPSRALLASSHAAISAFMAFLSAVVFATVVMHQEITKNTVVGAVCGYVLIAYTFAFTYAALEDVAPESILLVSEVEQAASEIRLGRVGPELIYFSFVTLTTLGYGDFVPNTPLARALVILEVLTGQLYLAAFVARLVGVMKVRSPADAPEREGMHSA